MTIVTVTLSLISIYNLDASDILVQYCYGIMFFISQAYH
jgi:hypothetical protein